MPKFGSRSKERLDTCDKRIQDIFFYVVQHFDCTVLEGHRSEGRQNSLFEAGRSQLRYPAGRHNTQPSRAVDVVPYPIDWNDRERFHYFSGFVLGVAKMMNIDVRWGGDWDSDTEVDDNTFDDLPHFELVDKKVD